MEKFLSALFCLAASLTTFAQVTKLPTYAIRVQYPIDNIKDTIAPKAGGTVKANYYITKDSIIFHYNSSNLLEMEQIFRTTTLNANPIKVFYPDTSRFYRKYLYDSKNRTLSIQHWTIIGSPDPSNPRSWAPFPGGDTYYHHAIQRIDSFAYDSHDAHIFYRRYEPFNFSNSNFTMVIKDGWENDYQYDELGRLSKEDRSIWEQNTKYRILINPDPITYVYRYQGASNKILARKFYGYAPGYGFIIGTDSLFTYDNLNRITSWKTFPYYHPMDGFDYSKISYFDTTIYNGNSYESNSRLTGSITNLDTRVTCGGAKYDQLARVKFLYSGLLHSSLNSSEYNNCNSSFTIGPNSRVHHYNDDNEGNLLSIDSAYASKEYTNGYTLGGNIYFDTIAYYNFKKIEEDPTTSLTDQTHESIINVYPNPASYEVNILTNGKPAVLILYSMEGRICLSQEIKEEIIRLNISHLQSGIYILELNGHRKKLVIQ